MPLAALAWPDKPVTVVVGYAAGGTADLMARLIAQKLAEDMGQAFIVDNKPGANGNIGAAFVAKAPADGYTLLFGGSNNVTNTHLYQKLPFDFQTDFVPVGMVASLPNILVVNPSVSAKSVAELIALAKANPGTLSFGSSGMGSSLHLSGELFAMMAGVKLLHVPYKSNAGAIQDLLGGNISLMFDNAPSALVNIRAGKVRAIGVTSAQRSEVAPDIPTIAESGLPGFSVTPFLGFFAPAKVPLEVAEKLNKFVGAATADPEIAKKLRARSADTMQGSLKQTAKFVQEENLKWAKVVKESGVTLD
jgi:tripartite-type tricarboxylate transporter receptor subunit TctC